MTKKVNIEKYKEMIITIEDLMHQFYGYPENDFINCTHEVLMYCYDEIEQVKEVSGKDIYTGAVLLVADSKNKLKMYANPYAEKITNKPIKNINDYENMIITIDCFMQRFYNFPEKTFLECTHRDIQMLIPDLMQTTITSAKELYTGETLLVQDSKGKIRTYMNPSLSQTLEEYLESIKDNENIEVMFTVDDDIDKELNESFLQEIVTEEQLDKMSTYELAEAIKVLKKNHENKIARLIQKELYFRPDGKNGTKQKNKKLERIRKKESEDIEYGKY